MSSGCVVLEPRSSPPSTDARSAGYASAGRAFHTNDDLGVAGRDLVGAPADFDCPPRKTPGDVCFACAFEQNKSTIGEAVGHWNKEDLGNAFDDLQKLIRESYAAGVCPRELVGVVREFYETQIRTFAPADFGEWTDACIYEHVVFHVKDHQPQECVEILYKQIQSLRHKTWVKTEAGEAEPHHKNIELLAKLIKGYMETHKQLKKT